MIKKGTILIFLVCDLILDELTAFFRDAFNNNKIQILSIDLEVTDDDFRD